MINKKVHESGYILFGITRKEKITGVSDYLEEIYTQNNDAHQVYKYIYETHVSDVHKDFRKVINFYKSLNELSHIDNIDWLRDQKILVQGKVLPQNIYFLHKNINI